MKLFSVPRNLTSIALGAYCAIGISSTHAQTYTLIDLGALPGPKQYTVSTPAAINEQAQVAGTSESTAFRYTSAKALMEDVGRNPAGGASRGFGINGFGQVVGDSTFGKNETSRAAVFSNGAIMDLGVLKYAGLFSRANGINSSGQVVGFSGDKRDGSNSRAFIISTASRSRMIDLGTLGGPYAQAMGINDAGFVTGNAQLDDGSLSLPSHAFVWQATKGMVDLGTLGGRFSYGTSISSKNHIAGYSMINNVDDRIHAFLHNGSKMIDLGSLSGAAVETDLSFALGVNTFDQVVGYSYLPPVEMPGSTDVPLGPLSVAFIYSKGLMVNLNDRIGKASDNYRLDSATAINDQGQIVAIAFDKSAGAFHSVLLTPDSSGSM